MANRQIFWLALGGLGIWYVINNQTELETAAQAAASDVGATLMGWKSAGAGPQWVPILNQAEQSYGLPADMLARQAYQESSFIENIIRGIRASSAGALGIMQLMPQYFSTVQVPIPFSDTDVSAQISQAGQQMQTLHQSTGTWELALAAYNAGLGNVQKYGGIPPFQQTQDYVSQIIADVPAIAYS